MDNESIATLVEQAFPLARFSDAASLFTYPSHPEEDKAFEIIRGLTWKDLDVDTVLRIGDALLLATPYGFLELLPAYLLGARTAKGQQFALDELVFNAMAPPESESFVGDLPYWEAIANRLCDMQKRAILAVFCKTTEECSDPVYHEYFEEIVRCLKERGWPTTPTSRDAV